MITTIKNMSYSLKLLQIDKPVNRINYILKKKYIQIQTFQRKNSILCNYYIFFIATLSLSKWNVISSVVSETVV